MLTSTTIITITATNDSDEILRFELETFVSRYYYNIIKKKGNL